MYVVDSATRCGGRSAISRPATFIRNYPEFAPEDAPQALAFAAANLEDIARESTRLGLYQRRPCGSRSGVPQDSSRSGDSTDFECIPGSVEVSKVSDQEILAW